MTNKEAIGFLQSRVDLIDKYYPDVKDYREALVMAIKSLEAFEKLDTIITKQIDVSTNQVECQTLRWVLDKMSEMEIDKDDE